MTATEPEAAPEEAPQAEPEPEPEPEALAEEQAVAADLMGEPAERTEYVGTVVGVGVRQFQSADGTLWDVDPETGKVTGKAQ